jgi:hypothetical protein
MAREERDIASQEAITITVFRRVRELLSGQGRVEGAYD